MRYWPVAAARRRGAQRSGYARLPPGEGAGRPGPRRRRRHPPLAAALGARPDVVTPNLAEAGESCRSAAPTRRSDGVGQRAVVAATGLVARGARGRGPESPAGRCRARRRWRATRHPAPRVEVRNPIGAGDALVGGLRLGPAAEALGNAAGEWSPRPPRRASRQRRRAPSIRRGRRSSRGPRRCRRTAVVLPPNGIERFSPGGPAPPPRHPTPAGPEDWVGSTTSRSSERRSWARVGCRAASCRATRHPHHGPGPGSRPAPRRPAWTRSRAARQAPGRGRSGCLSTSTQVLLCSACRAGKTEA